MLVLVTGGAGFIGSHVVDLLLSEGYGVRVLDNLSEAAHSGKPTYLNPGAEYVWGDVSAPDVCAAAVSGVDSVCHQAARVGLGVDFGDAVGYVADNDLGTATLLKALFASSFRGPVVLASSMVVYGEGGYSCPTHGRVRPAPRREEHLRAGRFEPPCPQCGAPLEPTEIDESEPVDPRSIYAATKLHQEHLCQTFSREVGCPVVSLRYHNVYGPRMPRDTPYAGVASIFRSLLEAGRPPRVFEDGMQRRDFIHVSDIARANLAALQAGPSASGCYNIATGVVRTIADMAHALAAAFGPGAPSPVTTGEYRLGDVRHITASPEAAARCLGFRHRIAFEEGMADFATAELRAPLG
ncbi:MAG: NAD-dependent epimerase/dehydratase family protein [Actinomycetota bacterium]|nr:NAD-dependent epimerase/dehydratase family protein [Actinomycetota bacterium]